MDRAIGSTAVSLIYVVETVVANATPTGCIEVFWDPGLTPDCVRTIRS